MTVATQCRIAVLLSMGLGMGLCLMPAAHAQSQSALKSTVPGAPKVSLKSVSANSSATQKQEAPSGVIAGRVTDRQGAPQPGITITILRQDGRYSEKVSTQSDGRFRLSHLAPGLYAAEVAQPSFLPFWRSSIPVEAGAEFLLDINLLSLADSVEIGIPDSLKQASDDWKWVLRSSYPQRPILRFEPRIQTASTSTARDARERALRGTVQFAAGNQAHGFGQDPAMHTAIEVAYPITSSQELALAGSAGWEHGTPAASLRTAWTSDSGTNGTSTFSMTVRQMFLSGNPAGDDVALGPSRRLQSLTMGYEDQKDLGDHIHLLAGSLYDSVRYGDKATRVSPFARLTISPSDRSQLAFVYTAANPRVLPSDSDPQYRRVEEWLAVPQISADENGRTVLEGGRHVEAQWQQQLAPRVRWEAAAFYDDLSQTALSLSLPVPDASFAGTLLRDPLSNRYFLSAGNTSSPGVRLAVAGRLSHSSEIIVGYAYAGTIEAPSNDLLVDDATALRQLLHDVGQSSFTIKAVSRLPGSHTRMVSSYRWLPQNAVAVSDPYDRGMSQSEPYLNLYIVQPIPAPDILPGQFEAIADFNNLLAQGYLTLHTPGGANGVLFPASRSFRGGFNFIF